MYSPNEEEVSEIPSEAARFYKYARSKIAELKRVPTNPRKKRKKWQRKEKCSSKTSEEKT